MIRALATALALAAAARTPPDPGFLSAMRDHAPNGPQSRYGIPHRRARTERDASGRKGLVDGVGRKRYRRRVRINGRKVAVVVRP